MLARENKSCKSDPKDDKAMLAEIHDMLLKYYKLWYGAFVYYTSASGADPYHMSLNPFTTFLDECQVGTCLNFRW